MVFNVVVSRRGKGFRVSLISLAHESVVDGLEVMFDHTLRLLRVDLDRILRHSFTTIACFLDESGVGISLDSTLEEFLQVGHHRPTLARALLLEPSASERCEFV